MAGIVLEAKNLTRTYGTRKALDNVSITLKEGEMVALIGPSGSGKSTLLRSATGLILTDKDGGEISLMGLPVQKGGKLQDTVREARSKVGFVFQQFNLVGRLSLFENVMLGALGRLPFLKGFFGNWPKADKDLGMRALDRVGVADYAAQRANLLSGGQQQRGAIARALVQGAQAIFLDEPVASLDPVSARKVMELLEDLNKNDGVTIAVVLHQIDYALKFCDRIIALKAGKIVYDGPKEGLVRDRLVEIYGAEYDEESGGAAPLEETPAPTTKAANSNVFMTAVQLGMAACLVLGAGFALYNQTGIGKPDISFSILSTENSQNAVARWQPFLEDMNKQTGLNIKPYFQSNYAGLVNAMIYGQTQVGWFSNKSGMEAVKSGRAEVFLRSSDPSGIDGYQSILIVNAKSNITLDDVLRCDRRLEFGMGDASSTSGTLVPMVYLFAPQNIDPNNCFKVVRSASHEANFYSVSNNQLPVATNNTTSLQVLGKDHPELLKTVRVIWTSPVLPEDPIIWRKDLDPEKKEKIRNFFLHYGRQGDTAQQERERGILASLSFGMFQPANNTHLLPVQEMQAREDLLDAQKTGDNAKIADAQKALDAILAQKQTAIAPALLPSTPTNMEEARRAQAALKLTQGQNAGGQR